MKLPLYKCVIIIGLLALAGWALVIFAWELILVKPFLIVYLSLIVIGAIGMIALIHG